MNLIKRMKRVTTARIESLLSSVEDPEIIFPQLIREMEEQVSKATEAEAQALTTLKTAERSRVSAKDKVERMLQGAELALSQNDEETAREALSAQVDLEKSYEQKDNACKRAEESYENARTVRIQTKDKLSEIKSKQEEIINRARLAKNQKQVEKSIHSPIKSSESILDAIDRMESKVEQSEAELAVRRELDSGITLNTDLEKRLEILETDSEVETRLAALKEKMTAKDS